LRFDLVSSVFGMFSKADNGIDAITSSAFSHAICKKKIRETFWFPVIVRLLKNRYYLVKVI